jgi:hypothetical protein
MIRTLSLRRVFLVLNTFENVMLRLCLPQILLWRAFIIPTFNIFYCNLQ